MSKYRHVYKIVFNFNSISFILFSYSLLYNRNMLCLVYVIEYYLWNHAGFMDCSPECWKHPLFVGKSC